MRTIAELVVISLLAFSSAFFIGEVVQNEFTSIKTAEAMCGIGQYYDQGEDGMSGSKQCRGGTNFAQFQNDTENVFVPIINTVAAIILAVSLISFIYAGYQFIMYGANPQNAEKAKSRMLFTGIAIIITLSVYSLFRLINSFTTF